MNEDLRAPRSIDDILDRLTHIRKAGNGWQADCPCPGHDTPQRHLSVKDVGDKALVTCFQLHTYEEIIKALSFDSLTYDRTATKPVTVTPKELGKIVCAYDYTGADGNLLYQVVRYDPKDFRQRRPDGKGAWTWNLNGITPVLFMLPDIVRAVSWGEVIFIAEGEKDALNLWGIGLVATTNSGGAGKWRPEYADVLTGGRVIVIPDNDKAGRLHSKQVCDSLYGKALSLKVLEIPAPAKDVTELLEAGGDWIQFDSLVETQAFNYTPGNWPPLTVTPGRGAIRI